MQIQGETNPEILDIRQKSDSDFISDAKAELDKLEIYRHDRLMAFKWRMRFGIPLMLLLMIPAGWVDWMLLTVWRGSDDSGAGLTVALAGAFYWWITGPRRQYAKDYKSRIMPKIAALFGNLSFNVEGKIPMYEMEPSRIIPHHTRYKSEDHFSGTYKGVDLQFSEIKLTKKQGSGKRRRTVTVFKGLAVLLDLKTKRFYGHTVMERNRSKLSEWFREKSFKLDRADLVDPEFEKIFDVYTNDQVEARYLIDPATIERMKALYDEYDGKQMAAAFFENKMLVLIASKHNHFEPPKLELPASDPESLLNMKREVGEVLSLVDRLELYDPAAVHQAA